MNINIYLIPVLLFCVSCNNSNLKNSNDIVENEKGVSFLKCHPFVTIMSIDANTDK